MALQIDPTTLTGYDTHDRYFAARFGQGSRKVYSLDLPLAAVPSTLPRPDPANPTPGNRRVDAKHAHEFGQYVRERSDWVSPALMLRAPGDILEFEQQLELAGSQYGTLSLPRVARSDLGILDGQHRILGIHMALEEITEELRKARDLVSAAKRHGENPAVLRQLEGTVKKLQAQRERFSHERLAIQVVLEDEERGYKQMFDDIAENAKGITKTLQALFDSRKVVNRSMLKLISDHPLLAGRIEEEVDQVKRESQFLTAKHVTDIIRAVAVGLGHRVSRKQEEELDEGELVAKTTAFLAVLTQAFPDLEAVQAGSLAPGDLRGRSLLGSATMLRVLAGAYHELSDPRPGQRGDETPGARSDEEITAFFTKLGPYMGVPVSSRLWLDTGIVEEGASAPKARGGDILRLANHIVSWARAGALPLTDEAA